MKRPIFSLPKSEKPTNGTRRIQSSYPYIAKPEKTTNSLNLNGMEDVSLTIVTAYIDIGRIRKGKNVFWRDPNVYWGWTKIFGHLLNPLVVYTDSVHFLHLIQKQRSRFPERTKIIMFDKTSSWAFSLNKSIERIYERKEYPKYIHENPTIVNYSCVQHAKYEITQKAAEENFFGTDYIAWLDVGLFRESVNNTKDFILSLPPGFNDSKIAVSQVNDVSMDVTFWPVFRNKLVWICGCTFIGTIKTVKRYTRLYKRTVQYFIKHNLMNTDEQILYATYTDQGRTELKPDVDLQLYMKPTNYTGNHWFYIGYTMRHFIYPSRHVTSE